MSVATEEEVDWSFLRSQTPPSAPSAAADVGIVDLFSGCGGLTIGALEGSRRAGLKATLQLAVDSWAPALEVIEATLNLDADRLLELDLTDVLGGIATQQRKTEERIVEGGRGAALLIAGPPCQGHSALNNHTRHDDARNDLYLAVARVARLIEPRAVIVENVRGVGRDRRRAVERCAAALEEQGYEVESQTLNLYDLGAPQQRIRHVLVATMEWSLDFDGLPAPGGRDVAWAIRDLDAIDGRTLFDSASVPTGENQARMNWLLEQDEFDLPNDLRPVCHHSAHSYRSMYGRLRWDEPAQTVTSGFGSMGQGRFVHPGAPRTITPHEAARLQFLPDFMDFGFIERRTDLATMIGNAAPPVLTMAIVEALIEQGLI